MAWSPFRVSNAAKRSKRRRIHAMHPVHKNRTGQPWNESGHDGKGALAIGEEIFLDVIAVGLEQHVGAAQLADLLVGAFDHAMALARLLVEHLAPSGDL